MQRIARILFFSGLGFAAAGGVHAAQAQPATCGLKSVETSASLVYPPIAKAAHVRGEVIILARFGNNGDVIEERVLSGPELLEAAAVDFVRGWRANPFGGSRECPIVVRFALTNDPAACAAEHPHDLQHPIVCGEILVLDSAQPDVSRRH